MTGSRSRRIAAQRGISSLVVVALALVTVVLTVTAVLLYAGAADKEQTLKALADREKRVNAEQGRINTSIKSSKAPAGFAAEAAPAGSEAGTEPQTQATGDLPIETAQKELAKRRKKYFLEGRPESKEAGDPQLYTTLQELVVLAAGRVVHAMNRADRQKMEADLAEERKETRGDTRDKLAARKIDYNSQLAKLIDDINAAKTSIDKNTKDRLGTEKEPGPLVEQINTAGKELKKLLFAWGQMDTDFRNQIHKLQGELEAQKVKEVIRLEITRTHGKILTPDIPNKVAFVDIGSRERVVPGLKFLVGKTGPQGKFHPKGKVVVKKVWMTYAEVLISDIYDRNLPIVDGDLIVNPLFDPRRPVVVTFFGDRQPKRLRPNWSVNEAARRIQEIGSEVRERLPLDVDFAIVTEFGSNTPPSEKEDYDRAVLLGIPVVEASEVFKYLED